MKNRSNVLLWLVIGLVILNVSVLLFFTLGTSHKHRPPRFDKMLHKRLDLSDEQMTQYQLLIKDHHQKMRRHMQQSHALHDVFFKQFGNDLEQQNKADSLAQRIGQLQTQIELETYEHFNDLRKLLTPEQQVIFDQEIGSIMAHMMTGPPKRPGPHRRKRD